MIEFTRRPALISLLIGLLIGLPLLAPTDSGRAQTPPPSMIFAVARDGTRIGTQRLAFRTERDADGERLIVDSDIDLAVRVAFVTAYRYKFTGREVWRGDRLLALDTATDRNGTKMQVHVRLTAGGLAVEATDAHYVAPADVIPDSYWPPGTVRHVKFIDTENGKLVDLVSTPEGHRTITFAGKPVEISMYRLAGEIDGAIGYASDGEWMLLQFRSHGSDILYTREAP